MSNRVQVKMATATNTSKGIVLTMTTVEGPTVEFVLDDMAASLLGLTLEPAIEGALHRDIVFYAKESSE